MTNVSFYADGLKFSCKRCSACCRYDSGFVFLSEQDLKKLTAGLKMDAGAFIKTYCRWVISWQSQGEEVLSLKEKSNKDCVFWDSGCTVYETRPLQCRTFPFWESIVDSVQSWEMAASGCPGMNEGVLHTGKAIGDCVKMRLTQPIINKGGFCKTSVLQEQPLKRTAN